MKTIHSNWLILSILMLGVTIPAFPQGTAFMYHGRLNDNGGPANGSYDLIFSVFDAPSLGNQVGSPLTNTPVGVTNGIFTALLDFGPGVFTGPDRWLEMGVRTNGVGDLTLLSPRQRLTPTPYAMMANTASNLLGALPAGQLSGQLAVGQLPANIPRLDGNSTFTGTLSLNNPANTFVGHGSSLTGLNPANLSPGTAAINISGNAATATAAATAGTATTATTAITATTAATAGTAVTANNFSGLLAGDVTGSQGATVVASVGGHSATSVASGASAANAATFGNTPDSLVRRDSSGNFAAGAITATSFTGDGSGLTALSASQLANGTLADGRLSTNVASLNAHQTFSGSNTFTGVVQLSHTNNIFVGTFSGDGSGLSNIVVAAANLSGGIPASLLTGTLPSSLLAGCYSNAVTFDNPANSFAGNGAWLSNVNATALGGVGATNFWQLGGNAGTTAEVDFLGTTDGQPLELRVNNIRALRLEPNPNGAPNLIGGAPLNYVAAGVMGATISGGGTVGGMQSNSISSDFATIAGGAGNTIQQLTFAASTSAANGGGQDNAINGAARSVIAGGANNRIFSSQHSAYRTNINSDSTISGGYSNSVEAPFSNIGGGIYNRITTNFPGRDVVVPITNGTIAGGISNTIWGNHSTISGGRFNTIRVTGGMPYEYMNNGDCTIGGGSFNRLKDYSLEPLIGATISGGSGNLIAEGSNYSFIGGGLTNWIYYNSRNSVIAGGKDNTLGSPSTYCSIGGGWSNSIVGWDSTIGGGSQNKIWAASYATIPGGQSNAVERGDYAFAAGRRAKATQPGVFVWADSTDLDFDPYCYPVAGGNSNSFNLRATGGLHFVTAVDGSTGQPTSGMYVSAGGSGWNTYSDRNAKTNFAAVDGREILRRLEAIPITSWNYKTQDPSKRHIGPMAQDFNAAFEVGEADKVGEKKHIHSLDMDGVALAAIQGLNEIVQEQKADLKQKAAEIQSLQKRLDVLERAVLGREMAQSGGGQ